MKIQKDLFVVSSVRFPSKEMGYFAVGPGRSHWERSYPSKAEAQKKADELNLEWNKKTH